jgi:hypothetical protein
MARDAIARQYDVDKNSVNLAAGPEQERYQPGTITFAAKKGRSVDLNKLQESITATRLSGSTNMGVDYLEITARGKVLVRDKEIVLKVSGTQQELVLAAADRAVASRLRAAAERGEEVTTVTGRVEGWNGRFPVVLKALAERYGADGKKPMLLLVTGVEAVKQ